MLSLTAFAAEPHGISCICRQPYLLKLCINLSEESGFLIFKECSQRRTHIHITDTEQRDGRLPNCWIRRSQAFLHRRYQLLYITSIEESRQVILCYEASGSYPGGHPGGYPGGHLNRYPGGHPLTRAVIRLPGRSSGYPGGHPNCYPGGHPNRYPGGYPEGVGDGVVALSNCIVTSSGLLSTLNEGRRTHLKPKSKVACESQFRASA